MAAATSFSLTYSTHNLRRPILQALDSTGTAVAQHTPGYTTTDQDGREWEYVQFDSSGVAAVAGAPAVWAQTTTNKVVTSDVSDASELGEGFAGVFMSVLTDQYYGWIQTKGKVLARCSTTAVGCSITIGAADSIFSLCTPGTASEPVGVCIEASSITVPSFPNVMLLDK